MILEGRRQEILSSCFDYYSIEVSFEIEEGSNNLQKLL